MKRYVRAFVVATLRAVTYGIQVFLFEKDREHVQRLQRDLNDDLNLHNVGSESQERVERRARADRMRLKPLNLNPKIVKGPRDLKRPKA